ncbi:MAG: hypothetical protein IT388_00905, partial [Nitrospirales bacterium]|nr:hypothetical protein [Nitrospirales bacterium]
MKRLIIVFLLLLVGTGPAFGGETPPGESGSKAGKESAVESLEEVVVTGSREAEPLKEKP